MIGSSENRISYNGNGIATEFAYTFKILEKSDMKVLHVAADGNETLLTKDYYVDMDKSVVLYPGYAPGAEIPEQNRPPILPVGERLVLYREVPITQESALDKHWPFNVIEAGLDKLTIICQQLFDRLQRSFYVSESTSTNFDTKVPIEAGKTFRVKDDGTGFEVTEDPAKVLPLAQGVYTQTKEQAEFAKEQADASSEAASAAKTSETNAKNYSENVNVFLPSVSDSGVLSWTNKAGLANPASVNIKGAKGDTGDKGDTGTAATIEVGTVTTGAAGSSASVVNRGDANNAILDFILPKGADGKGSVITVNGKEPDAGGNVNVEKYTHPNSGVTAGTYRSVTVNAQGHVTGGSNPTLAIANGGTGATTASEACANIGALPTSGGTMTGAINFDKINAHIRDNIVSSLGIDEFLVGVDGAYLACRTENDTRKDGTTKNTFSLYTINGELYNDTNKQLYWRRIAIGINSMDSNYIRYENGIQMCWGINSVSANGIVTYPQPFKSEPAISISSSNTQSMGNISTRGSSTQFKQEGGTTCYIRWLAIGGWK